MDHIVKAETAPTMSQATTSASVFVALVVLLAALQVASVSSMVLAVVVALTALIVSPAIISIARTRA